MERWRDEEITDLRTIEMAKIGKHSFNIGTHWQKLAICEIQNW